MSNKESQQKPIKDIKHIERRERIADQRRERSKSLLHLSSIVDLLKSDKTLAEKALAEINLNQSVFAKQLSIKDLQRFKQAAATLQKNYKSVGISGGITPRAIINRSRKIDIDRCQREIPNAVPIRQDKHGVVTFRTDASGKNGAGHHIVYIHFLNFQAALNAGRNSNALANSVSRGAIKFDCDCGRHRFWYRYIATAGGFAYGKGETGFPKIRNPELVGLACKHVLRVMTILEKSPAFTVYMKKYIEKYRKDGNARRSTYSKKQADRLLKELSKESWKNKGIRQTSKGVDSFDIDSVFNVSGSSASVKGKNITPNIMAKKRAEIAQRSTVQLDLKKFSQNLKLSGITKEQAKLIDKIIQQSIEK